MKPTTSVLGAIRLRLTTKKANKDYYKGASSVDPACLRLELLAIGTRLDVVACGGDVKRGEGIG